MTLRQYRIRTTRITIRSVAAWLPRATKWIGNALIEAVIGSIFVVGAVLLAVVIMEAVRAVFA